MLKQQQTIKKAISYAGVGLHTGNKTKITFNPAPVNSGIRFKRTDLKDSPEIPADIDHVVDISRGTTIGEGEVRIHTVEHVLAAIVGLEIDNVLVELDGNEPPVGDGSAMPFVEVLLDVGLVEQDSPKDYLIIERTLTYSDPDNGIDLVVVPSDEFRITFMVDYKNPALGTQYTSMYSLSDEFVSEYAPSRTFCFLHEVEELWDAGLIKGGSLDNAVVIIDRDMTEGELEELRGKLHLDAKMELGKNGILNGRELRYPNEPVRHKVLDLIGDLALLGVPLQAHVMAARSGHAANVELVKQIRKEYQKKLIKAKYQGTKTYGVFLDTDGIHNILPHRFPFLLVDKIVDLVPQERVVGIKNVTISEWFFQGHFPGRPVMPGVLIVEAMAQVGGILMLNTVSDPVGKTVYFAGIDNVRFRKPVLPGDQLTFEVESTRFRKSLCRMSGKAFVDGDLVCEAEFSAAFIDEPLVKEKKET